MLPANREAPPSGVINGLEQGWDGRPRHHGHDQEWGVMGGRFDGAQGNLERHGDPFEWNQHGAGRVAVQDNAGLPGSMGGELLAKPLALARGQQFPGNQRSNGPGPVAVPPGVGHQPALRFESIEVSVD